MTFTDEELAYLKAELPHNESILFHYARKAFRLEALLHRLEAAEKVVEYANEWAPKGIPALSLHLTNWRKAAGK